MKSNVFKLRDRAKQKNSWSYDRPKKEKDMPVSYFKCKRYTDGEILQGVSYFSGTVIIGGDAWRLLDKMDSCSYAYKVYENMESALKEVSIVQSQSKAYYLPDTNRQHKGGYIKHGNFYS